MPDFMHEEQDMSDFRRRVERTAYDFFHGLNKAIGCLSDLKVNNSEQNDCTMTSKKVTTELLTNVRDTERDTIISDVEGSKSHIFNIMAVIQKVPECIREIGIVLYETDENVQPDAEDSIVKPSSIVTDEDLSAKLDIAELSDDNKNLKDIEKTSDCEDLQDRADAHPTGTNVTKTAMLRKKLQSAAPVVKQLREEVQNNVIVATSREHSELDKADADSYKTSSVHSTGSQPFSDDEIKCDGFTPWSKYGSCKIRSSVAAVICVLLSMSLSAAGAAAAVGGVDSIHLAVLDGSKAEFNSRLRQFASQDWHISVSHEKYVCDDTRAAAGFHCSLSGDGMLMFVIEKVTVNNSKKYTLIDADGGIDKEVLHFNLHVVPWSKIQCVTGNLPDELMLQFYHVGEANVADISAKMKLFSQSVECQTKQIQPQWYSDPGEVSQFNCLFPGIYLTSAFVPPYNITIEFGDSRGISIAPLVVPVVDGSCRYDGRRQLIPGKSPTPLTPQTEGRMRNTSNGVAVVVSSTLLIFAVACWQLGMYSFLLATVN